MALYHLVRVIKAGGHKMSKVNIEKHRNSHINHQSISEGPSITDYLGKLFLNIWRNKTFFIGILVLSFIASAVVSYLIPERFVARASILPTSSSGGFSSIMSSFGNLPMIPNFGVGTSGTQLYTSIAKSDYVINRLLKAEFEGAPVLNFLIEAQDPDSLAVFSLNRDIKQALSTNINLRNDVFTIQFCHKNKYFAAFVVNTVVEKIEDYLSVNLNNDLNKQMNTIEKRLKEVSVEMRESENDLLAFWEHNSTINQSAKLRMAEQILLRQKSISTELYLELVRQRELLSIKMSGNGPILKLLDSANVPMVRSSPNRVKIVGVSMVLSLLAALAFLEFFGSRSPWLNKNSRG